MWTWIIDLFRSFISLFDRVVYWFAELLISLFDSISTIRVFSDSFAKNFSSRIYAFIAVIMIFKVSFSIIQYIINPDSFSDKERGMGKTIQGIVLSLVCVVIVPYIFEKVYLAQDVITKNHYIERIILGINSGLDSTTQSDLKKAIPFRVLTSFVRPNVSQIGAFKYDKGVYTCNDAPMFNPAQNGQIGEYNPGFGNCINPLSKEGLEDVTINGITDSYDTGGKYNLAWEEKNYALLLDLINHKWVEHQDVYIFEYKFIISTVAGVFIAIMYLNFCIDLAIRSVKFGFLQLIAPIPIISMIDPRSSKNGMMSKWLKTTISTYLGLFIRVAVVSFVVVIMEIVFNSGQVSASGTEANDFLKIVILFGALLFAKEAPKLISDLTGIDLKGDFKANPLTRLPLGKTVSNLGKGLGLAAGSMLGTGAGIAGRAALTSVATPGQAILHKLNPNRFASAGQMWRGAGASIYGRLHNGGNRTLSHLKGGLPKFMQGSSGGSGSNASKNEYRDNRDLLRQGEELYNRVRENGGDMTSIFQNREFAENVSAMQSAKMDMINANNRLEEIRARANSGDLNAQAMLGDAMTRSKQASDLYEERKKHVDMLGQRHKGDYKKFQAYKAYKDLYGSGDSSNQQGQGQPFTGYEVAQPVDDNPGSTMPSVGGSKPSTGGSMPSVGGSGQSTGSSAQNTGGSMPSVGGSKPSTGGSMPNVGGGSNRNP